MNARRAGGGWKGTLREMVERLPIGKGERQGEDGEGRKLERRRWRHRARGWRDREGWSRDREGEG